MARRAVYRGSLDGSSPIYKPFPTGNSQTLHEGDIVLLSSGKVVIGTDAASAGTVLGIVNNDITTGASATADDISYVDVNPMSIYSMSYTGSAAPTAGAKYDMGAAAYQFDSDDTTGGYIQVVGNIDTTGKYADVILTNRVFGMA